MYLPALATKEEAEKTGSGDQLETQRGHGEKILVVEDDEAVRLPIKRVLGDWGYMVEAVADAETALGIAATQKRHYDLVISDTILPGMSGVDLAERLLTLQPDQPIILCSGYAYADLDLHWPKIKAHGLSFLEKPVLITKLLQPPDETRAAQDPCLAPNLVSHPQRTSLLHG